MSNIQTAPAGTFIEDSARVFKLAEFLSTSDIIPQHFQGKTIVDSQGGGTNPTVDILRYLNLWRKGKLKLKELITNDYPFADVNLAIDDVRNGKVLGRAMLEIAK